MSEDWNTGYKGACWTCEPVAELNIALEKKLAIAVEALEKYAELPHLNHVVVTGPGEVHNAAKYALDKIKGDSNDS